MYADIIIKNSKCMTMKEKQVFEWLAIRDGKIIGLGDGEKYYSLLGECSIVLDAKGNTVLPGFIDSHFHLVQTALNEESVNLHDVSSFDEIGEKIQKMEQKRSEEHTSELQSRQY